MTFEHAGWCSVHGDYNKGPCTCGADQRREGWNAAVEECAATLEMAADGIERVLHGGGASHRTLAAVLRRLKVMG